MARWKAVHPGHFPLKSGGIIRFFLLLLLACHLGWAPSAGAQEALKEAARERLGIGGSEAPLPAIENPVAFVIRFDSQVRGLSPGASVEIKGIRIGAVTEVALSFDQDRNAFVVFVTLVLQPDLFPSMGARPQTAEETYAAVAALVERGLRASLASKQLIGGPLVIDLDIMEDVAPASLDRTQEPPLIPTGPSQAEKVKERLQALIDKISNLPLDPLLADAKEAIQSLKALVEGPELKEALVNLRDSTAEIESFVTRMDSRLDSVVAQVNKTVASGSRMFAQAGETLASVQRSLGDRSPILTDLRKLLRELEGAARSLRLMADYLERHPDALIRGKKDTRQ